MPRLHTIGQPEGTVFPLVGHSFDWDTFQFRLQRKPLVYLK